MPAGDRAGHSALYQVFGRAGHVFRDVFRPSGPMTSTIELMHDVNASSNLENAESRNR